MQDAPDHLGDRQPPRLFSPCLQFRSQSRMRSSWTLVENTGKEGIIQAGRAWAVLQGIESGLRV